MSQDKTIITGSSSGIGEATARLLAEKGANVVLGARRAPDVRRAEVQARHHDLARLKAYPGGAIYGGTKWFVRDFMEVLRMESAQEGTNIRTATIYPAAINTINVFTVGRSAVLSAGP